MYVQNGGIPAYITPRKPCMMVETHLEISLPLEPVIKSTRKYNSSRTVKYISAVLRRVFGVDQVEFRDSKRKVLRDEDALNDSIVYVEVISFLSPQLYKTVFVYGEPDSSLNFPFSMTTRGCLQILREHVTNISSYTLAGCDRNRGNIKVIVDVEDELSSPQLSQLQDFLIFLPTDELNRKRIRIGVNSQHPSGVSMSDIGSIFEVQNSYYSPCASIFILKACINIYSSIPCRSSECDVLSKDCYHDMYSSLSASHRLVYCAQTFVEEKHVTARLVSNFQLLLMQYQKDCVMLPQDHRIAIQHQSPCMLNAQSCSFTDFAVYYRYRKEDNYVFRGEDCLYPFAFCEFAIESNQLLSKKEAPSIAYANHLFKQHLPESFAGGVRFGTVPLLGVTMGEQHFILRLYFPTLVPCETSSSFIWKVGCVELLRGAVTNTFFFELAHHMYEHIQCCKEYLAWNFNVEGNKKAKLSDDQIVQHIQSTLPSPYRTRLENTLKLDNYIYKSYDYRGKRAGCYKRSSEKMVKYSKLPNLEVFHKVSSNWETFVLLRYPFIEGSHIPTHVIHILHILTELMDLHARKIVHADIRQSNMVFAPIREQIYAEMPKCAYLIDFDLSCGPGSSYPPGYNASVLDVKRHPQATAENFVEAIHDCFAFASICDCYTIDHPQYQSLWQEAVKLIGEGKLSEAAVILNRFPNIPLMPSNEDYAEP